MREEAVHAGFLHRRIKNKLGFPVFVSHLVIVFDSYSAKGLAPCGQTISKHAKVGTVCDSQQGQRRQQYPQNDSTEPRAGSIAGFINFDRDHSLNYTRRQTRPDAGALTILHKKTRHDLLSRASKRGSVIDDKIHQNATNRELLFLVN